MWTLVVNQELCSITILSISALYQFSLIHSYLILIFKYCVCGCVVFLKPNKYRSKFDLSNFVYQLKADVSEQSTEN